MSATLLPFTSADNGVECPICTGESNDNDLMVFVPGTFQRPAPTEPHYHLDCYITWAMNGWLDHLRANSGLTEHTIRQYAHFVHCIWNARRPWTVEGLLDPNITPAMVTRKKAKTPVSVSTCKGKAKPAWTGPWGFLTWLTNAPAIPDICLKNKNLLDTLHQDLNPFFPYWRRYLRTQTKLSVSGINRYLNQVADILKRTNPWVYGAKNPAWDGAFGFVTWLHNVQAQTQRDKHSVHFMADWEPPETEVKDSWVPDDEEIEEGYCPPEDIIPEISEDPIPAGPTFEPRTIEITTGPKTLPEVVEEKDPEIEYDLSEVCLDAGDTFVENFLAFSKVLVTKNLISMEDVLNPARQTPCNDPCLFMFRYLYEIYRKKTA